MDFEWTRLITVVLAILAIIQLSIMYNKSHNLLMFVPMSWVILVLMYEVFKFIVNGDLKYYTASVIMNSVILIQGLILLIVTMFLYKDYTYSKIIKPPHEN